MHIGRAIERSCANRSSILSHCSNATLPARTNTGPSWLARFPHHRLPPRSAQSAGFERSETAVAACHALPPWGLLSDPLLWEFPSVVQCDLGTTRDRAVFQGVGCRPRERPESAITGFWWRRGELNPRPKIFKNWPLHAYSAIWSSPSGRPQTGCRKASRFNFGRPSNRRTIAT
jgi:hypothetical protein